MEQQILLRLQQIGKSYPSAESQVSVLRNINLEIKRGEMLAIMGPSGSGKSTLMNILGCLDQASEGQYLVAGRDVSLFDSDGLSHLRRDYFGFIFQRYNLLSALSAAGNVEMPAIYANLPPAQRQQRAIALLTRLGLKERAFHKPNQLSGGQQQRVSIARALMNDAEIILADEPTGALDQQSGREVLNILQELNKEGRTIIIVTHDAKVAQYAHRIIELQDGQIISDRANIPPGASTEQAEEQDNSAREGATITKPATQTGPEHGRSVHAAADHAGSDRAGSDQARPDDACPEHGRSDPGTVDRAAPERGRFATSFKMGADGQSPGVAPAYAGPEPGQPDYAGPDHAGPDYAGTDYAGPDHARPVHVRPGHAHPDRASTEQGRFATSFKAGGDGHSPSAVPAYAGPEPGQPDHAGPDYAGPDYAGPDHARPDHIRPGHAHPDRASPERGRFATSFKAGADGQSPSRAVGPAFFLLCLFNNWRGSLSRLGEAFSMALFSLTAHPLRSFLTMLGVIIGISSVISIMALGNSASETIKKNLTGLTPNSLMIFPGRSSADSNARKITSLSEADAMALARLPYIASAAPNIEFQSSITSGNIRLNAKIAGVGVNSFGSDNLSLVRGRLFNQEDIASAAQFVVIPEKSAKTLFPNEPGSALNKTILVGNVMMRVIGTYKSNFGDSSPVISAYIPYRTAQLRFTGIGNLAVIIAMVKDNVDLTRAQKDITKLLTMRHGSQDFFILNMQEFRERILQNFTVLALFIAAIALISLLVGGIGVMNIMLVTVTERITEIGVRMAIGARRSDILQQFLIEAIMVCVLGAIIGLGFSFFLSWCFEIAQLEVGFVYRPFEVIGAVLFSSLIGIVFGFWPARNASRLTPVAALARN